MTLFQFLVPILICFLLSFWQNLADKLNRVTLIENEISHIGKIPKCISSLDNTTSPCITLGYGIIGQKEQWIDYVLQYVAKTNDLEMGKDIQQLTDNIIQTNSNQFSNFIHNNPNVTQIGVVFCTTQWPILNDQLNIPCQNNKVFPQNNKVIMYTMFYNWTLFYRSPYLSGFGKNLQKDWVLLRLKTSIDNAIIDFFSKYDVSVASQIVDIDNQQKSYALFDDNYKERIEYVAQDFPFAPNRFTTGYDVVTSNGAFYFFVPIMINFIILINEVLREKQKKLRHGITVMGMSHFSYWLSWNITGAVINGITCFIQVLSGILFGFDIFLKVPFLIMFSFLWMFSISILQISFLISTICSDTANGYSVAYGFLLMSIVVEFFLTNNFFIYYLYRDDADFFVTVLKHLFITYPAYHFSKIFGDIAFTSGKHYSVQDSRWIDGKQYTYEDLFQPITGKFTLPKVSNYECPSTFESFVHLIITSCVYFLLTVYTDHVFPNNRGTTEQPLFFISPEYWYNALGFKKRQVLKQKRKMDNESKKKQKQYDYNDMGLANTIKREKRRVKANLQGKADVNGIRIIRLGKTYRKYPFGIKTSKDKVALKKVYLEIEEGELLAILGHNGAGKSTLINILSGLLSPTTGTAEMMGYDINTEMSEIQSIMGVCPQFDVLWDELTGEEHLYLFSLLKGIPLSQVQTIIKNSLQQVSLLNVMKAQVGTYSGGMKRRISLAISAIGNPKIIFMDEPTTGMDPKTRREIWEMVRNLKKGKVVVLTTHAMEEAEALADRIVVVAGGELKCIGTPLYLKNHYSDGYRLNLITEQQNIDYARIAIKQAIPSCKILDEKGGSIIVCVPVIQLNELGNFFKIMESEDNDNSQYNLKNIIKDWGLSHSTIEEVFMKITKAKKYLL